MGQELEARAILWSVASRIAPSFFIPKCGPALVRGTTAKKAPGRCSDSRITRPFRPSQRLKAPVDFERPERLNTRRSFRSWRIVPGYSGGTVPDFHRVPFSSPKWATWNGGTVEERRRACQALSTKPSRSDRDVLVSVAGEVKHSGRFSQDASQQDSLVA